jgi:hypothetical protein
MRPASIRRDKTSREMLRRGNADESTLMRSTSGPDETRGAERAAQESSGDSKTGISRALLYAFSCFDFAAEDGCVATLWCRQSYWRHSWPARSIDGVDRNLHLAESIRPFDQETADESEIARYYLH